MPIVTLIPISYILTEVLSGVNRMKLSIHFNIVSIVIFHLKRNPRTSWPKTIISLAHKWTRWQLGLSLVRWCSRSQLQWLISTPAGQPRLAPTVIRDLRKKAEACQTLKGLSSKPAHCYFAACFSQSKWQGQSRCKEWGKRPTFRWEELQRHIVKVWGVELVRTLAMFLQQL